MDKRSWNTIHLAAAMVAAAVLLFTWFYMREQFCWSIYFVVLLVVLIEYLKIRQWLKDTVSIQVIIHKNEKDDDREKK